MNFFVFNNSSDDGKLQNKQKPLYRSIIAVDLGVYAQNWMRLNFFYFRKNAFDLGAGDALGDFRERSVQSFQIGFFRDYGDYVLFQFDGERIFDAHNVVAGGKHVRRYHP